MSPAPVMIPKIIHFIFGLASDFGGKPFSFIHYMAIRSAQACNPDYRIRFYCKYQPTGLYWEAAKRYFELVLVEPPASIHGRPLMHVAHQADVLRLQYLLDQGGVYLDLDTITVQSFDPLLRHQMVMGVQGRGAKVDGLCNAVMLAAPGSSFVRRWLESYRTFRSTGRDKYWDEHSVQLPLQLARAHPGEITILDRGAFFYPSAEKRGILDLFVEDKEFPAAYCHHLWEGLAWRLIEGINERNVGTIDTSYNRMARRFVGEDLAFFEQGRRAELAVLMQAPIRLNAGCGGNKRAGWLNVDSQSAATPDLQFDLTSPGWPLENDSVGEVEMSHVLEHMGSAFETVIKELYRVCQNGAVVHVRVPHPRHDWFVADPTHTRSLLPVSFRMLDAEACKAGFVSGESISPLALYWGVDFELVETRLVASPGFRELNRTRLLRSLAYPFVRRWIKRLLGRAKSEGTEADAQLLFLSSHLNNVVGDVQLKLRVRKATGSRSQDSLPGAHEVRLSEILDA